MKKQIFIVGSIALALAAGAITLPAVANAAQTRQGGGHAGGGGGAHYHGGGGPQAYRGGGGYRGGGYYGGGYYGGGYGGGYIAACGPMQIVLGLCGPYGY